MVGLSRKVEKLPVLKSSFEGFDQALASGKLPATGKVTERLVRSALSALERAQPGIQVGRVPNPLPAPYDLNWYFGQCVCPDEIRAFATNVGRKSVRVWSVAADGQEWKILATVGDPVDLVVCADGAQKRLQKHELKVVRPLTLTATNVQAFSHDYARTLLQTQMPTGFVEFHLVRR